MAFLYENRQINKINPVSENSQIVKTKHNLYISSLNNTVICAPGYTTGHLDSCSVALSVPKAHMGHLVSCSAATESPSCLVNKGMLRYNTSEYLLNHRLTYKIIFHAVNVQYWFCCFAKCKHRWCPVMEQ